MKKIKKYFHLLMMISCIILEIMLLTISIAGFKLNDKYDILWICSKLETVNQMVNNALPLDDEYCGYPINIEPVETISEGDINDTIYTNSFIEDNFTKEEGRNENNQRRILNDEIYPTNDRRLNDDYKICYHNNNQNTIRLVYSNSNDECSYFMIQKIFVLDQKTLNYFFDTNDEDTSKKIDEYLKEKYTEEDNKDKNNENSSGDICNKIFVIFETTDDRNLFLSNIEKIKNMYKYIFPNKASTIISIISFISLFVLIILSLIYFFSDEDHNNKYIKNPELRYKLIVTGIFLLIEIGYFAYNIYECVEMKDKNYTSIIQKISADENFLKCLMPINDSFIQKKNINICNFVYLSLSLIIFIIGWSMNQLYLLYLRFKGQKMKLQWIHLKKKYNI